MSSGAVRAPLRISPQNKLFGDITGAETKSNHMVQKIIAVPPQLGQVTTHFDENLTPRYVAGTMHSFAVQFGSQLRPSEKSRFVYESLGAVGNLSTCVRIDEASIRAAHSGCWKLF